MHAARVLWLTADGCTSPAARQVERLQRELHELKHKYYAQKKGERKAEGGAGYGTGTGPGGQRFVGGGFKVDGAKG